MTQLITVQRGGLELMLASGDGWRACFSTRLGGVSHGPFAELNVSLSVGDVAAAVLDNRARLGAAAGFDAASLVVGRQVHGVRITAVAAAQRGCGSQEQETGLPDTDGLLTDEPELPLFVSTADCVPVVLAASGAKGVAVCVVHAGWRGMLDGIVALAAGELSRRGNLTAAIVGPSIGP
jgi:copper oxidase (laccase) domain-containing protein